MDIEIRMDHVDKSLEELFIKGAKELLDNEPSVVNVSGFDTVKKKKVTGTIISTVKWPPELDFSLVFNVNRPSIVMMPNSDGLSEILLINILT